MSVSFKSFVFLDLESTGLPSTERDGRRTRITEICMISVTKEHLLKCAQTNNYCPRVLRKITLPINPGKVISEEATELSGLDNFLLEHEQPFNEKISAAISSFLNTISTPLCLIAHNGYVFDFPLLKEELKKFSNTVIPANTSCSDSKLAFREVYRMKEFELIESSLRRADTTSPAVAINGPPSGSNQGDNSRIVFDSAITDIDLAFNQVANEIEQIYSPCKQYGEHTATDVIRRLNETTPKIRPLNVVAFETSPRAERRRLFENETTTTTPAKKKFAKMMPNFTLKDVYKNLFGEEFNNQHEAESDVIALIKCCAKYGQAIVDWFETNHKNFGDIRSMYG